MESGEKTAERTRPRSLWLLLPLLLLTAFLLLLSLPPRQTEAVLTGSEEIPVVTAAPAADAESEAKTQPLQLLKELIQQYRREGPAARAEIDAGLESLRADDPALAELWSALFDEMDAVVGGVPVIENAIPAGLPEDDSLCIVVFGFCLNSDGSMAPELVGRCETALALAEAYPRAFVAVTGGPTAAGEPRATEARAMAQYLTERGVSGERLILEERALSTADNAVYLHTIFRERFSQIKSLVVVSSSYHAPLCALLMTETALLDEFFGGGRPYEVVARCGFPVASHGDFENAALLADYAWSVAAPQMNARYS